jgi:CheY-like chemotaxis protein
MNQNRQTPPVDRSLFSTGEIDDFKDHDIMKTELLVIDDNGTEDDPVEEGADSDAASTGRPILLIVDDSRDILNYLRGEFREDYHVIMARDGKEGLTRAQKYLPQIIISDIMMPVINGYEFCEKIKSDMLTCHIPVILLTAKASDEDRLEGIEIGADAYISKPFEIDILKASVSQLIKSRSKYPPS